MKTYNLRAKDIDKRWRVFDAEGKALGRLATEIADALRGKDKPTFTPHLDMGDFVTVGVMGGQQIASIGKMIQVQTSYLQFPLAAANAVVLLLTVLMIVWGLTRVVDIRKEL